MECTLKNKSILFDIMKTIYTEKVETWLSPSNSRWHGIFGERLQPQGTFACFTFHVIQIYILWIQRKNRREWGISRSGNIWLYRHKKINHIIKCDFFCWNNSVFLLLPEIVILHHPLQNFITICFWWFIAH